jgi:hypothetical protein
MRPSAPLNQSDVRKAPEGVMLISHWPVLFRAAPEGVA